MTFYIDKGTTRYIQFVLLRIEPTDKDISCFSCHSVIFPYCRSPPYVFCCQPSWRTGIDTVCFAGKKSLNFCLSDGALYVFWRLLFFNMCKSAYVRVGSFHVNPRFHPTGVGWNLGLTRKLPTLACVSKISKNSDRIPHCMRWRFLQGVRFFHN